VNPPSDFDSTTVTDIETKKNSPNDWSFVAESIQGDDEDGSGNFRADTMLCFLKHGTLALTFHANSDGGIMCSKCFQFMKPGSFALHCDKCNKQPAPSAKVIQEWTDSDKKWANLKREFPQEFADKTRVKIAQRDGVSAYVIHPRLYLGKTASTITLKTICITDGCTHVCAFNALHRHFKNCHMNKSYSVFPADIVEAPVTNNIEDSSENEEDASVEASDPSNNEAEDEIVENVEERTKEAGVDGTMDKDLNNTEENDDIDGGEEKGSDEEKTDDKTETNNEAEEKEVDKEFAGGQNNTATDTQDMDCKPFEADNSPSDDDTEMGIEENKEGHTRAKKDKQTREEKMR